MSLYCDLFCLWVRFIAFRKQVRNFATRCRTRRDKSPSFTFQGNGIHFGLVGCYLNCGVTFVFGILNKLHLQCSSATNRLITAKDHASVQINVGHLDENGVYNGHFSTFALCGFIRAQVCAICLITRSGLFCNSIVNLPDEYLSSATLLFLNYYWVDGWKLIWFYSLILLLL